MSNPWEATELFGKMLSEYTDNGYRQGVYEERERIIALLETYWDEPCGTPFDPEHCVDCGTIGQLIALIKGENK